MDVSIVFIVLIYFFSIVMHEVAHGYVAYSLGDPTAKDAGRLTLNPIPHIDLVGTIILPLTSVFLGSPILFGWAKPVPFNPIYFRDIRRGTFFVAIAGIATNFALAIVFALAIRFVAPSLGLAAETTANLVFIARWIVWANLVLGIFNVFPIPPLDGSKVLFGLLPHEIGEKVLMIDRFGIFIILAVLMLAPGIVAFFASHAFQLLVGAPF